MYIVDVSAPVKPVIRLIVPVNADSIAVDNGIVYVGNKCAGLTSISPMSCAELK